MKKFLSLFLVVVILIMNIQVVVSEEGDATPFADFENFNIGTLRQAVNDWFGMGESTLSEGSGYYKVSIDKEPERNNRALRIYHDGMGIYANSGTSVSFYAPPSGFTFSGKVRLEDIGQYGKVYVNINNFLTGNIPILTFYQGKISVRSDKNGSDSSENIMNFRPGEHWYDFKMVFDFTSEPYYDLFLNGKERGRFKVNLNPDIDWIALQMRLVVGSTKATDPTIAYFDDISVKQFLNEDGKVPEPELPEAKYNEKDVFGCETAEPWYTEAYLLDENDGGFKETELRIKDAGMTYNQLAKGCELSNEYVKQGTYSLKWSNLPYYPTLSTKEIPHDWSENNMLSFWAYSERKTGDIITVALHSDTVATSWQDFYYVDIRVNWEGWKEIKIPFNVFSEYEDTVGFDRIGGIYFYTKIFGRNPNPYTTLYIDDFRVTNESEEVLKEAVEILDLPEEVKQKIYFNVAVSWHYVETPKSAEKEEYITRCVDGFERMPLFDYKRYIENKKLWKEATEDEKKALAEDNLMLRERYNIASDNNSYEDFVELIEPLEYGMNLTAFSGEFLNHEFPEVREQNEGTINYQPYFRNEKALYGYYPKFKPSYVSFDYDGNAYMKYGPIIQTVDERGRWYYSDITPFVKKYVEEELRWTDFRYRTSGQLDESKICFDGELGAYMMFVVQGYDENKKDSRCGLLAYSPDMMKTWQIYKLPAEQSRFEKPDTNNTGRINLPPIIVCSGNNGYTMPSVSGILLIPEKQPDGTLKLESVKFAPDNAIEYSAHSGDGNFAISVGDKIYMVYSLKYPDDMPKEERENQPFIPEDHVMHNREIFQAPNVWNKNEILYNDLGVPTFAVCYDRTTKKLSEPYFVGYAGHQSSDGHNWATITIDSKGYFHVIAMGHSEPFTYVRSKNPYDITEWVDHQLVSKNEDTWVSYAGLLIDKNDTLYSINRDLQHEGHCDLVLARKKADSYWDKNLLVHFDKDQYQVWFHKMTINPKNEKLFVAYNAGISSQIYGFKEDMLSFFYHRPDIQKGNMLKFKNESTYPTGAKYGEGKKAHTVITSYFGDMCILISDDGGSTWRLAVTEDFINK